MINFDFHIKTAFQPTTNPLTKLTFIKLTNEIISRYYIYCNTEN